MVAVQCLASGLHHLEVVSAVLLWCLVGSVNSQMAQCSLLQHYQMGLSDMGLVPLCVCSVMHSEVHLAHDE